MHRLIRLQPETFERLVAEAGRHNEPVDAAERILRDHLPMNSDEMSTLATLRRLERLRARMKPGSGAVQLVREGRRELERRQV